MKSGKKKKRSRRAPQDAGAGGAPELEDLLISGLDYYEEEQQLMSKEKESERNRCELKKEKDKRKKPACSSSFSLAGKARKEQSQSQLGSARACEEELDEEADMENQKGQGSACPPPAPSAFIPAVAASTSTVTAPPPTQMTDIIMKQKATGSWTLAQAQVAIGKVTLEDLKKAMPATTASAAEVELLWATALVVAYLAAAFPGQKVNWDLVVKKANTYISRQSKKLGITVEWQELAEKLVKANV